MEYFNAFTANLTARYNHIGNRFDSSDEPLADGFQGFLSEFDSLLDDFSNGFGNLLDDFKGRLCKTFESFYQALQARFDPLQPWPR